MIDLNIVIDRLWDSIDDISLDTQAYSIVKNNLTSIDRLVRYKKEDSKEKFVKEFLLSFEDYSLQLSRFVYVLVRVFDMIDKEKDIVLIESGIELLNHVEDNQNEVKFMREVFLANFYYLSADYEKMNSTMVEIEKLVNENYTSYSTEAVYLYELYIKYAMYIENYEVAMINAKKIEEIKNKLGSKVLGESILYEIDIEYTIFDIAKLLDNQEMAKKYLNKILDMQDSSYPDLELAIEYYKEINDYDNILKYAQIGLSLENSFDMFKYDLSLLIMDAYYNKEDYDKALEYYEKSKSYAQATDDESLLSQYESLIKIYQKLGNIDKMEECYIKIINSTKIEDGAKYDYTLMMMDACYDKEDYEKALEYYEKSKSYAQVTDDESLLPQYESLIKIYQKLGNIDKMEECYIKIINSTKIEDGDKYDYTLMMMDSYYEIEDYEKALEYYEKSDSYPQVVDDELLLAQYERLIEICQKLGNLDKMDEYYFKILKLKKVKNVTKYCYTIQMMNESYENHLDEKVLEYYEKTKMYKDRNEIGLVIPALDVYFQNKEYKKVLEEATQALQSVKNLNKENAEAMSTIYRIMASALGSEGNPSKAYEALKHSFDIKESYDYEITPYEYNLMLNITKDLKNTEEEKFYTQKLELVEG